MTDTPFVTERAGTTANRANDPARRAALAELRRWARRLYLARVAPGGSWSRGARAEARRVLRELPRAARVVVARHGADVAARYGISRRRQAAEVWQVSALYRTSPSAYYRYQLYRPERWAARDQYLEGGRLVREVYRRRRYPWRSFINNKDEVAAWAERHGVPAVGTLAAVDASSGDEHSDLLPDADIFTKPVRSSSGRGARWWRHAGDGRWADDAGALFDRAQLIAALRDQAARLRRPVLVQRFVRNHPDVAPLTRGGLATVRIVTCQMPNGVPETLRAVLRMPAGENAVDNFDAGGLAAPIDLGTGALGKAVKKKIRFAGQTWDAHPDTGGTITGRVLPDWAEAERVARHLHASLGAESPIMGWDVALTPNGPTLVEANPMPCTILLQTAGGPLGMSAYPSCIVAHLEHVGP